MNRLLPKKQFDKPIFALTLAFIVIGLIAVSSASSVLSFQRFGHNNYYFLRQAGFAAAGIALMLLVSRIDYRFWKKWSKPLMIAGLIALAAVLIPGLGFRVGGSRSWFNIGAFFVQPSEFLKPILVFYLASWFDRKLDAETNFWFGVLPPLIVSGAVLALVVLQPDLGSALMIAAIVFVILFAAGSKLKYLASLIGIAGVAGWALIRAAPYRAARITSFFDPSIDPLGIGYHINQALLAIGSGGFFGLGFGDSRQKHNYLPEPIGDSIFAVLAEEFGFLRITLIILLFAAFGILATKLALRAPDKFSRLTVAGITGWIMIQAIVNIGAISNLFPLTGISLPFISYGGSSLLALCIGVGVMLNISRHKVST